MAHTHNGMVFSTKKDENLSCEVKWASLEDVSEIAGDRKRNTSRSPSHVKIEKKKKVTSEVDGG